MPKKKKKLPGISSAALDDLKKLSPSQSARASGVTSRSTAYTGQTSHVRRDSVFTKDLGIREKFRSDSVLLAMKIKHEKEMKEMELEMAKMQARAGQRAVGNAQAGAGNSVGNVTVVGGSPKGLLKGASAVFGKGGYLARGAVAAGGFLVGGGKGRLATKAVGKLSAAKTVRALIK